MPKAADRKAYIITGPTSGIGRRTALELARHGTVVLVGRDRGKLDEVQKTVERKGQHAVSVVCDLSDIASVRRASAEIIGCASTRSSRALFRTPALGATPMFLYASC
jgi:short-subunit dehydrogenase